MTAIWIALGIVAAVALAALAAHFLPKPANTKLAQLDTDLNWLYDKVFPPHAVTPPAPAASATPQQPVSVTYYFGATPDQAGKVTTPVGPPTFNTIPVPAGMDLASFTALGIATQAVQNELADANVQGALLNSTPGWWNGLGLYFREEFLAQAPAGPLASTFATLQMNPAAPVLLTITAEQQAAANQAVAAVAPPKP